jgi:hypothetical protein
VSGNRSTLARRSRAKLRTRFAIVAFAIVALSAASAGTASACVGTGQSHWYGAGANYSVTRNNGLYSGIFVASSGIVDCYGFIQEAIWEGVADSATLGHWVEAGWTHGYQGNCGIWFYWARNTPCCNYAEHRVNNRIPTVGNREPVQISYGGSGKWNVFFNWIKATAFDGSVADITAGDNSRAYQYGLESTHAGNYSASTSTADLQYRRLDGTWTNSVDAGSTLFCDSPAWTYWVTTNQFLRSGMNS